MDVLSDVLHTVRLRSVIYCHSELTAPWGLHVEGVAGRAGFFVVTRGSCYLETEGSQAPLALAGGDLIVLPHGGGYTLRDALTSPVAPLQDLLASCPTNGHKALRHGSGGALTTMVQGCFQFENGVTSPLLGALPSLIHVRGENGQMVPWLEVTLKFIACEATSQLPGTEITVARLTDILFIQTVRAYIAALPGCDGEQKGNGCWLRALVDEQIGKALTLIHAHPNQSWTVAELASRVGMSRSAFSSRFTMLVGVPPLTYVTRWRMHKAGDMMRQGKVSMAEIRRLVGYESQAAFSKAFKRETGVAPGTFRRQSSDGRVLLGPNTDTLGFSY
jgi:AraC family transcriptional regulator, alkane utilization regulator